MNGRPAVHAFDGINPPNHEHQINKQKEEKMPTRKPDRKHAAGSRITGTTLISR
jgi:hypothetical protein